MTTQDNAGPEVPALTLVCGSATVGDPVPVLYCDGPEDCQPDEACFVVEGSVGTYASCLDRNEAFGAQTCRNVSECPPDAVVCEPYTQGRGGIEFPVSVCRQGEATPS